MTTTIAIRILLAALGVWILWTGFTVAQLKKLDGVRIIPIGLRTLMVIVGILCLSVAIFSH